MGAQGHDPPHPTLQPPCNRGGAGLGPPRSILLYNLHLQGPIGSWQLDCAGTDPPPPAWTPSLPRYGPPSSACPKDWEGWGGTGPVNPPFSGHCSQLCPPVSMPTRVPARPCPCPPVSLPTPAHTCQQGIGDGRPQAPVPILSVDGAGAEAQGTPLGWGDTASSALRDPPGPGHPPPPCPHVPTWSWPSVTLAV